MEIRYSVNGGSCGIQTTFADFSDPAVINDSIYEKLNYRLLETALSIVRGNDIFKK